MEQNKTYEEELAELDKKYNTEKFLLVKKHAYLSRKYEIGDIITDGNIIIKIDRFTPICFCSNPTLILYGIKLKKDLTPLKNNSRDSMYQNYVTKKLNKHGTK